MARICYGNLNFVWMGGFHIPKHLRWYNKDLSSRFHYFHMSRPRRADEHVCVGPLAHWHTIPWHINSCLRWDCHYGFCVACFQGPLPGNVGFFSDLCFCTYAAIGQLLWLMVVMLKTAENQSITQRQRKKMRRGGQWERGVCVLGGGGHGRRHRKRMAPLYFIVLKG